VPQARNHGWPGQWAQMPPNLCFASKSNKLFVTSTTHKVRRTCFLSRRTSSMEVFATRTQSCTNLEQFQIQTEVTLFKDRF